ncbi:MAG: hypothetical protein IIA55_00345 [Gemmatimonadetes bacterium]|nr:hypothetical protein [Gemmatimonadota bacterium]MCH8143148.1 hypothetical protein [Gemmatimonadota bacterium]MCH8256054.1 hypothetical protein [Gemmatimonadota bacterium]
MSDGALRRTIHVSTGAVVLVGVLAGWHTLRLGITGLAVVALFVELVRLRFAAFREVLARTVPVFRPEESRRPCGAFWLLLGYASAAWIPVPGAAAGILTAAVADPIASAVGGRWGGGEPKSWIGTGAVLAASLVVLLALRMPLVAVVAASVTAAASERWSRPLDDNLVLAPAVAAVIWMLT